MRSQDNWLWVFEHCTEGIGDGCRRMYLDHHRAGAEKLARRGLVEVVDVEDGKYPCYRATAKGREWWIKNRVSQIDPTLDPISEMARMKWRHTGLSAAKPGCEFEIGGWNEADIAILGVAKGLFRLLHYYWSSPYKTFEYFRLALTEQGAALLTDGEAVCG